MRWGNAVINLNTVWHTTEVSPQRRRNDVSDGRTSLGLGFYYLAHVVTGDMPGESSGSSGFAVALSLIPRRSADGVPPVLSRKTLWCQTRTS